MRPVRRAKLAAFWNGVRRPQQLFRGNKANQKQVKATKISTEEAYIVGSRILELGRGTGEDEQGSLTSSRISAEHPRVASLARGQLPATEEQTDVGESPDAGNPKVASLVRGQLPVIEQKPVSQVDLIDALTAVITGRVEFSDDNNADDADAFSFKTLSTICSRIDVSPCDNAKQERLALPESTSIEFGEMFFYMDPKNRPKDLMTTLENGLRLNLAKDGCIPNASMENKLGIITATETTRLNQDQMTCIERSLVPATPTRGNQRTPSFQSSPSGVDELDHKVHFRQSLSSIRSLVEEKVKDADRDGLFAKGCEMYKEGERLLYEGHVEQAREVLRQAHSFQKRALRLVTNRLSAAMHKQGLDHCDRGDRYLAVILLGVSEIMKHRPSAANIHLGAQIHRGYRRICPKELKYIAGRREIDGYMRIIQKESSPMAKTLRTFSNSMEM